MSRIGEQIHCIRKTRKLGSCSFISNSRDFCEPFHSLLCLSTSSSFGYYCHALPFLYILLEYPFWPGFEIPSLDPYLLVDSSFVLLWIFSSRLHVKHSAKCVRYAFTKTSCPPSDQTSSSFQLKGFPFNHMTRNSSIIEC